MSEHGVLPVLEDKKKGVCLSNLSNLQPVVPIHQTTTVYIGFEVPSQWQQSHLSTK